MEALIKLFKRDLEKLSEEIMSFRNKQNLGVSCINNSNNSNNLKT